MTLLYLRTFILQSSNAIDYLDNNEREFLARIANPKPRRRSELPYFRPLLYFAPWTTVHSAMPAVLPAASATLHWASLWHVLADTYS